MPPPLLLLQDISVTFGVTPLLTGAELAVASGDRVCLVGRNGSGKSTLLRIAAGLVQPDAGDRFAQAGATIHYLPQEPDLSSFATTLTYVEAGFSATVADSRHRALYLLKELGLSGEEDPAALSGGEARRAALARALAPSPDILLLDEPTNHLDLPGIEWLERELEGMRSGIVLISHDRRLLERISRTTIWLDRGITRILNEGFNAFEPWRDAVLEQEASEQHKLGRRIAMEEDWLRYGVTARRTRNQRRLAELHALRRKRKEQRAAQGSVRLKTAQAELSGRLVAVAQGISKSYGGHPVVRDFSARIMRGDRVGIVGPNGAGKTTLLNLPTGALVPDTGEVRLGSNLAQVILDQRRETLDPARHRRQGALDRVRLWLHRYAGAARTGRPPIDSGKGLRNEATAVRDRGQSATSRQGAPHEFRRSTCTGDAVGPDRGLTDGNCRLECRRGRPRPVCTRSGTVWRYDTSARRRPGGTGRSRGAVADFGNAARGNRCRAEVVIWLRGLDAALRSTCRIPSNSIRMGGRLSARLSREPSCTSRICLGAKDRDTPGRRAGKAHDAFAREGRSPFRTQKLYRPKNRRSCAVQPPVAASLYSASLTCAPRRRPAPARPLPTAPDARTGDRARHRASASCPAVY
jgi:ATPase subunit of ABC transporter with duplicated ATPase domains